MTRAKYRVDSADLMVGPLLPDEGTRSIVFNDRQIAVVVAAKSMTHPFGSEIRVTAIASGEVIFRKTACNPASLISE